ncbi:hypothetical protein [Paraburkholderia aspalathi]|uniref:hypothetical protein n=1 Tax=Paraburkholderia aspalathi TaxID=1324617 RepID=UPI0038BB8CA4
MNIRIPDTYGFDSLPSRHEPETRRLERAVASYDVSLRAWHREYREIIAFRRTSHMTRLARVLWRTAWRLPDVDDQCVAALCGAGNLGTIAGVLGEWLGPLATPVEWVSAIDFHAPYERIPASRSAYCMQRVVAFGQAVVGAGEPDDLEDAAICLIDAARSVGASQLTGLLLRQASVEIRRPALPEGETSPAKSGRV